MPVGELFILGFYGKVVPGWLKTFAGRFGLGGVILFDYACRTQAYDNNIEAPEQVRQLCAEIAALPSGPLVFIDQEGGLVRRLKESCGFAPLQSAKDFNRLAPEQKRAMLTATGGVNTHRGALWALGLLSAAAAATATDLEAHALTAYAAAVSCIPDPVVGDRRGVPTSHGALARHRYGATGATGEAQAGFPHVRRLALPALRSARARGADEPSARLDALVTLMAHLDDTCVLHRGGAGGLRALQTAASAVLTAGGCHTPAGRSRLVELDHLCTTEHLSPGGSADLLAAALFIDALEQRT